MIRHSSTPAALPTTLATLAVLLTACSDDSDARGSAGNDTASSTPTQSAPSQSPPTQPAPSPTGWTPLDEGGDDGILPAGRYGLTVADNVRPDLPRAVVQVPEGFSHFGGWALFDEDPAGGGGVGYWTVYAVHSDPCDLEVDDDEVDVVDVDTVEEAAVAFRAQRGSRVSMPRPVSLDGYQGLYLELKVPRGTNFAACPEYHVWDIDSLGGGRYLQSPGTERLWILDVEGAVVIINLVDGPDVPEPAREQLIDMVESVEFVRWP